MATRLPPRLVLGAAVAVLVADLLVAATRSELDAPRALTATGVQAGGVTSTSRPAPAAPSPTVAATTVPGVPAPTAPPSSAVRPATSSTVATTTTAAATTTTALSLVRVTNTLGQAVVVRVNGVERRVERGSTTELSVAPAGDDDEVVVALAPGELDAGCGTTEGGPLLAPGGTLRLRVVAEGQCRPLLGAPRPAVVVA